MAVRGRAGRRSAGLDGQADGAGVIDVMSDEAGQKVGPRRDLGFEIAGMAFDQDGQLG